MSFRLRITANSADAEALLERLSGPKLDDLGRRIERDFGVALRDELIAHVYAGGDGRGTGLAEAERALPGVLFEARFADAAGVLDVSAASVVALSEVLGPRASVYEAFVRIYAPRAFARVVREAGLGGVAGDFGFEAAVTAEARATFQHAAETAGAAPAERRAAMPAAFGFVAVIAVAALLLALSTLQDRGDEARATRVRLVPNGEPAEPVVDVTAAGGVHASVGVEPPSGTDEGSDGADQGAEEASPETADAEDDASEAEGDEAPSKPRVVRGPPR